jgi:homoprotocatechuate degradation regulator HpaR
MPQPPLKDGFEFAQTRRTLPMALLRAREAVMERFRPMLLEHGVTEQQWRVLRVLHEAGKRDATELAAAACILAPSLTRILKTLEGKGLIATRKDPGDRRRALIELTPEGSAFIRKAAPASAAIYADLEASLGRERIETLLDELGSLLAKLERS